MMRGRGAQAKERNEMRVHWRDAVPDATSPIPRLERFHGVASLVRRDPQPADAPAAEDDATAPEADAASNEGADAGSDSAGGARKTRQYGRCC